MTANKDPFLTYLVQPLFRTVAIALLAIQTAQLASAAGSPVYVFSTFSGDDANGMKLRIYTSPDAVNFTLYADTGYSGPSGCSLRDPSIMKHTDGRYYVVFTAPPYNNPYANQNFVGLAWSTDLQKWNTLPNVSTSNIPGVKLSWAPEWVVDGSGIPKFTVNCSSTSSDLKPYLYTATSSDLTAWSGPVDIGIGAMHLDTQVLKEGDTWHCFTKSSLLQHATAPAITGPWTWLPDRSDWANLEGPCAVQLSNGSWVMQVDPMYDVAQYMTSPDLTNWSQLIYLPGPAGNVIRHGTVIRDDAFNLAPSGLRATPGNANLALQWNAFGGAASYNVKRSQTNGGPYTLIANVTGTNFTDSNVVYGSTYYYVVSMNYGGTESPDSPPVSAAMASNVVSLVHRYSFSETSGTTVADSVGGPAWNGTLPSGGTLGGGQVQLRASGSQYVRLPAGILSNYTTVTIEAWVSFPTALPANCFFFGFGNTSGNNGSSYIFCQPKTGRIAITQGNYTSEQSSAPNPSGNWSSTSNLHVTAVFNPQQGQLALYTNDQLAAQNASISTPLSAINNVFSYIGRSLYSGDSYFDFNLNEFRIYSGAFSPSDVSATQALGPDQLLTPPPAPSGLSASGSSMSIQLSWTAAPGATVYNVKRSLSNGGSYTTLSSVGATRFIDTGLSNGTTYYYIVSAINDLGEGANSSEIAATTYSDIENWRFANFGTISNTGNAADNADPDGDGWTNAQERASGTDPNNRTSLLKLSQIQSNGSDMVVSFATVAGKTYRLERSDTLQSGSWVSVQTNISGTGGVVQITDAGAAAQAKRFYRVTVP